MERTMQGHPRDGSNAVGITGVLQAVRTYMSTRFLIVSQGGTVFSAFVCCYLLYGQAHGQQVFGWPTVVGGISAVLLALVRRLIDDVEDLRNDVLIGRIKSADGGRRHLRGLILGAVTVTAVVGALNATCSLALLAVSVGIAVWFAVATLLKHTPPAQSSQAVFYAVNETCAIAGLLYPYAVWHEVAGASLPTMAVVATVGLFLTVWEFWMFTRKVGVEGWPPWFLSMSKTRAALLFFLALAAVFSALVGYYADLPLVYSAYGVGLSIVFAAIILRWWSRLPAQEPHRVTASWGGVNFAVGVEAGVLIGILLASL